MHYWDATKAGRGAQPAKTRLCHADRLFFIRFHQLWPEALTSEKMASADLIVRAWPVFGIYLADRGKPGIGVATAGTGIRAAGILAKNRTGQQMTQGS